MFLREWHCFVRPVPVFPGEQLLCATILVLIREIVKRGEVSWEVVVFDQALRCTDTLYRHDTSMLSFVCLVLRRNTAATLTSSVVADCPRPLKMSKSRLKREMPPLPGT